MYFHRGITEITQKSVGPKVSQFRLLVARAQILTSTGRIDSQVAI